MSLRDQLTELLSSHANQVATPDYLLADYLMGCLENFDRITKMRDEVRLSELQKRPALTELANKTKPQPK